MCSNMTIQLFALEMQISVDCLIKKFLDIGIVKNEFDLVNQSEKSKFFQYMRSKNDLLTHKFSLKRKTHSTLNILSIGGKNKQIQVEVRKKQVYVLPRSEQESFSITETAVVPNNRNHLYDHFSSVNSVKEKILLKSDSKNTKDNVSLNKNFKNNKYIAAVNDLEHQLPNKTYIKIHKQNQKYVNKKKQFIKVKDNCVNIHTKSVLNDVNNDDYYNTDKFDQTTISELYHNTLENSKQNFSKTRLKNKIIGKSFRHKKNSVSHILYQKNLAHKSNQLEKLYSSRRISKNKCKHSSTLIQSFNKPTQTISRNVVIGEKISVLDLADKMSVKSTYMIKLMMKLGVVVTINEVIDQETAQLVIEEMGHHVIFKQENALEKSIIQDNYKKLINRHSVVIDSKDDHFLYKARPPIVTIMGHVDHGKTSLLDYIRSTRTVDFESGGITQGIGAYHVTTAKGGITFLDTPGHAAFINMRIRGTQLTDIVVLVVAADDGVMPQTIESIQHTKSTNAPMIVAINKIDKSEINIDRIKNELNNYGYIPEEWGGNTQFINVSAISGVGINDLLDAILLQSEMLDLKVSYHGPAKAVVIESSLDKGKGPIIVALIKEGTLKCGDIILCGTEYGRVRAMRDEYNRDIDSALPSMSVEVLGLSGVPNAGDILIVLQNEKKAREVALYRKNKHRENKLARMQEEGSTVVEHVFNNITRNHKIIELYFIVKSDTQGSMEAICEALIAFSTEKVMIKILLASIGNITETDTMLALTASAIILGFNVRSNIAANRIIVSNNIDVRYYSVIYDLLDSVQNIIKNHTVMTAPKSSDIIGSAKVHNIFRFLNQKEIIAGCIVIDGVIKSNRKIVIFRNNTIIHKGELGSLRRFKNDVEEVKIGMECGIGIKNYNDIRFGDIIKVLNVINIFN